jgi:hypothetical protein
MQSGHSVLALKLAGAVNPLGIEFLGLLGPINLSTSFKFMPKDLAAY